MNQAKENRDMRVSQAAKGSAAIGTTEGRGAERGDPGGDRGFDRVLDESDRRRAAEQDLKEPDGHQGNDGPAEREKQTDPAPVGAGPGTSIARNTIEGGPLKRGRRRAALPEQGLCSPAGDSGHRLVGFAQRTQGVDGGGKAGPEDVGGGFSVQGVRGCREMSPIAAMRSGVSARGLSAVQLDLNHPELGEAMLQVELSADGAVTLALRVADGAGRAGMVLEELERALEQQGVSVESAEIKNGSREDSGRRQGRFGDEVGTIDEDRSMDRSVRRKRASLRSIVPVLAETLGPSVSGAPEATRGVVDFLT